MHTNGSDLSRRGKTVAVPTRPAVLQMHARRFPKWLPGHPYTSWGTMATCGPYLSSSAAGRGGAFRSLGRARCCCGPRPRPRRL